MAAKVLYNEAELARLLQVSESTIPVWRSRAPIKLPPGFKVGRHWLYDESVVNDWIDNRHQKVDVKPTASKSDPVEKRGRGRPRKGNAASQTVVCEVKS